MYLSISRCRQHPSFLLGQGVTHFIAQLEHHPWQELGTCGHKLIFCSNGSSPHTVSTCESLHERVHSPSLTLSLFFPFLPHSLDSPLLASLFFPFSFLLSPSLSSSLLLFSPPSLFLFLLPLSPPALWRVRRYWQKEDLRLYTSQTKTLTAAMRSNTFC